MYSSVWKTFCEVRCMLESIRQDDSSVPASSPEETVVLIPAYREGDGIGRVCDELKRVLDPTILVVNRPAGDATADSARRHGAIVVKQEGRGKGDAVRQGLEYIHRKIPSTSYIGMIDADCTYPAYPMPSMRAVLRAESGVGMVIGQRRDLGNNSHSSRTFALGNRILGQVHRAVNGVTLQDPFSGLRMVRAQILCDWRPKSASFDIECELNNWVQNVKRQSIVELPVEYRDRIGDKKLGLHHGLTILVRMLVLSLQTPQPRNRPSPPGNSRERVGLWDPAIRSGISSASRARGATETSNPRTEQL